jgi:hypothetical protein
LAYWAATAATAAWCATGGRRPERLAAAVVCIAFIATQFATPFEVSGWRAGVALVDGVTLIALVLLTVRFDRWWLVFAAGTQLVTVLTHLLGWTAPHLLLRTNVEVRWLLGLMLLALLVVGPFEARRLNGSLARS